ncbi:MAG: hypothetical protein ABGX63_00690 [bacterium]
MAMTFEYLNGPQSQIRGTDGEDFIVLDMVDNQTMRIVEHNMPDPLMRRRIFEAGRWRRAQTVADNVLGPDLTATDVKDRARRNWRK